MNRIRDRPSSFDRIRNGNLKNRRLKSRQRRGQRVGSLLRQRNLHNAVDRLQLQ